MKAILLGLIQGNLPALEACFEQAEKEGYDAIVHTGDVAGPGPFPGECAEYLRQRNIRGVRGRWEEALSLGGDAAAAQAMGMTAWEGAALQWTMRRLDAGARIHLASLPFDMRVNLGGRWLAVYHAGPVSLRDLWLPSMPPEAFAQAGQASGADIVGLGRGPEPFERQVDGRLIAMAPALGAGGTHTGYAVVISERTVRAEFRRIPYDADRAARAAAERGFPPRGMQE